MILKVRGHFDAAHRLVGYDGDCSKLHGHRWEETLAVSLQAMTDPTAGSEWNCNGIMVRVEISKEQTQ